jgi:hypothetical protein
MWTTILGWLKEYGTWALEIVKEYGKKAVIIILFVTAAILTTVYVVDNKIRQVVPESIEQTITQEEMNHENKLIESQETYTMVKQKLRSILRETGCQYIYLIEYHNGSENVASAFPFYKFDVTMDIYQDGVPYIDINPLKDEHIFKYDIFDNPDFTKQQFMYCSFKEFESADPKLYRMASQNQNISWVYTYNLYYQGKLMGAILILSYDELNLKTLVNNLHEVEDIFNRPIE